VSPRSTALAGVALAVAMSSSFSWAGPPAPSPPSDDDVEVPAAPAGLQPAAVAPGAPGPEPPSHPPATPIPQAGTTEQPPPPVEEIATLRARLDALEARSSHEPARLQVRDELTRLPTTSFDASPWSRAWPRGLLLSGYVQGQYQQSQLSQDQLDTNGNTLNQDRVLVRRARLRFDRGWDFAFATVEVDGNNLNGIAFGLRRAEASLLWRARDPAVPPLLTFTIGLTDIPFGYELFEPNRTRLFLERSTASRAFFPGDPDFGARVMGAVGFFRYAVGVYDGTPVPDSEPTAAGFDPTSEKDIIARFGAETQPAKDLGVSGGVSFVRGTGFHAGSTTTKNTLQWQDVNQNGAVDPGEVQGIIGQAATPSKTFERWALGVDAQVRVKTPIGRGLFYGEVYVGSNYDRGLLVADPTQTGIDLREVGWYAAYVQEVTPYGLVGLRVDAYNPNGDATTQLGGNLAPRDQTITTWSPLVGLVLPGHARLVFEYDHVLNLAGIDSRGVPTALREDQWALRLQVEL
jgi:hypothetical protein